MSHPTPFRLAAEQGFFKGADKPQVGQAVPPNTAYFLSGLSWGRASALRPGKADSSPVGQVGNLRRAGSLMPLSGICAVAGGRAKNITIRKMFQDAV
jgi:hypothetical protein